MPVDWLTLGMAGAGIGSSLLGGLMGSQNSGDMQREAGRRSVELSRNQAMINSRLMAPYVGAGNLALQKLWGYGPVGSPTGQGAGSLPPGTSTALGGGKGTTTVPILTSDLGGWDSPTGIGGLSYGQTGKAFDRTGGAGKYMGDLESLIKDFKFDSSDPGYRYKTEESTKSINKALASRGLFDSRAGVNMLSDADRAIMADEYDKQYNRKYGGLTDLFKMAGSLGETGYQSLLDAVKVGSGAGATAGSLGTSGAANLTSAYGQMGAAGAQNDANKASLWSGIGAMPMNAMLLYNLLSK
jgi:hypothetical protein